MQTSSPTRQKNLTTALPWISIEKAVSNVRKLSHEIRWRLANLISSANKEKNLKPETAIRLSEEINIRAEKIVSIRNIFSGSPELLESFMDNLIDKEMVGGKRTRVYGNLDAGAIKNDINFVISLLELSGVPKENSERFFTWSIYRQIVKNNIKGE